MSWLGLEGKTAVVTGATGGIGQAICRSLAEQGVRVVVLDRDFARAEEQASGLGQGAFAIACDLSAEAEVAAAALDVEAEGGCDILVNSAAILRPGGLDIISQSDWSAMLAVNLTGYLIASQAFGRSMLERGSGAIVHVASISGSQPQPASGAYSASKAAVVMLSRQLAYEWGPRGVRSNCVSPGLVNTPMSAAFYADPDIKARREAMVPLGRIGDPQDMADVVLFLASERASYVNGQDMVADGGLSQGLMGLVPRPGFS